MSVSKLSLYANGNHKEALGHFANIVKIAQKDGVIAEGEREMLERMAQKLEIKEDEYKEVMGNPDKFPIGSLASFDKRIERLYYLTKMVLADGTAGEDEVTLLKKIAYTLHFENDELVSKKAISLINEDNDLDDFTLAVRKLK